VEDKKKLSERDICTQYITPALQQAGRDFATQVRVEVSFTNGRVIVRGKLHTRGKQKRADYVLYYAPNLPIAVIEAKDNNRSVGDGMQQGLNYAETLDVPFAISSNGDAFLVHDRNQSRRTDGPLRPPQGWPRRVPHAAGPPRRHVDRIRLAGCLKTGPKWGSTAAARKKATGTAAAFPGTRRRQSFRLQGGSGP